MVSPQYFVHDLVGESKALKKAIDSIRIVSPSKLNVLIQGESGTGKELAAKAISCNSGLPGPLVAVNCAALPGDLVESELFGHEKGSFTGAMAQKKGKFELAHRGILFLDEIGDFPLHLQPKLLRAIESQKIQRVGAIEEIPVDVRVIAATNKNLKQAVERGEFRADLYYRLCMTSITLPPLRERPEDIAILAWHFVQTMAGVDAFGIQGKPVVTGISPEAVSVLCSHDWPGNVRELKNVIGCGIIHASCETIQAHDLPIDRADAPPPVELLPIQETMVEFVFRTKREFVIAAYKRVNGNHAKLAALIPINPAGLPRFLDKLGLSHLKQTRGRRRRKVS